MDQLDEFTIYEFLRAEAPHLHIATDDLRSPNANVFMHVSRWFVLQIIGCKESTVEEIQPELIPLLENPDYFQNSMVDCQIILALNFICDSTGFDENVTVEYILNPDRQRITHLLSHLIKFLTFRRNMENEFFSRCIEEEVTILQGVEQVAANIDQLNEQIQEARITIEEKKAERKILSDKRDLLGKAVQEQKAEMEKLQQEVSHTNGNITEITRNLEELNKNFQDRLAYLEQVETKIVPNPELLQEELERETVAKKSNIEKLDSLLEYCAEVEEKLKDLPKVSTSGDAMTERLVDIMKELTEAEKMTVMEEDLKSTIAATRSKLNSRQKQISSRRAESGSVSEKLLKATNHFNLKVRELQNAIEKAKRRRSLIEALVEKMELLLKSDRSKMDDKETKWSFIRGNFFAKECSHFVPQVGKCDENGCPLCSCGAAEADHYADVRSISARNTFWSEDDIVKLPTNAYGKLIFAGLEVEQKAKYLRLSDDSVLESTLKLFTDHWKLNENEPELLISLFGDGPEFNMAASLKKQIFNRGLIPAVEITKGWIITFGLNVGVAKAVGEAICEGQYYFGEGLKTKALVQCIGIVPWSTVRDTHALMCSGKEDDSNSKTYHRCYDVDPGILPGQPISLNPFHTHFLLVDDGRQNEHSNVAKFRAALEKKISTVKEGGGLGVPTVCILIGGDAQSLLYLEHSALIELPVLVYEGTGRAADILCYAYRRYKECEEKNSVPESFIDDIKQKVSKILFSKDDLNNEQVKVAISSTVQRIINICSAPHIYLADIRKTEDTEIAILLCLLECQKSDFDRKLQLAIHWRRAQVAESKIFAAADEKGVSLFDPAYEHSGKIYQYFTNILIDDQLDFIKLFIDHGFPISRYLTIDQLRQLYRRSLETPNILSQLLKMNDEKKRIKAEDIYLCHIFRLMKSLTRRFRRIDYESDKPDDNEKFETNCIFAEPYHDLLIWALLNCRIETAEYFWELCADPLITAVAATLICDRLASRVDNISSDVSKRYKLAKDKFEEKAVNLIDIGFTVNKEKAMKLACTPSAMWGESHAMDLAAAANDNEFLASQCCQTNIFAWWKAGFDAAGYLIVFATFTLLPILFLVDFDDETIAARDEAFAVIDADKKRKTRALRNKRQLTSHLVLSARSSGDYPLTVPFIWMAAVVPKKRISCSKKLFTFYTSPVVKFTNHLFWYALFLLLHAYVLLFSFRYVFTWPEILLHVWFLTLLFELGRTAFLCGSQSMVDKFLDYLDYSSFAMWNRIELYSAFLQILVLIFRSFATTFGFSRLLLAVNFILYTFRLYKVFLVNSYLGPKVIMMLRMTRDLFMFLMLLIIMMIAYSVTSQALLYPHRNYYAGIFYDILNHGIWEIFGDLDSVITDPNLPKCGNETFEGNISALMSLTSITKDCNIRNWAVPLLLAIYLFFGNILLVNMLIAIFASVFEDVQKNSEQIWKSLMYFLVTEFREKTLIPPPFIIFHPIYYALRRCCKTRRGRNEYLEQKLEEERRLIAKLHAVFECECRSDYLSDKAAKEEKSSDVWIKEVSDNVTKIHNLLAELHRQRDKMSLVASAAGAAYPMALNVDSIDGGDEGWASNRTTEETEQREQYSPTDTLRGYIFH